MNDKSMTLKEFIKLTNKPDVVKINDIDINAIRPHIICEDGYEISVQASTFHHCYPRLNNQDVYDTYEIMQCSECELEEFIKTVPAKYKAAVQWFIDDGSIDMGDPVSQVPHKVLEKYILSHGGIKYLKDTETHNKITVDEYKGGRINGNI